MATAEETVGTPEIDDGAEDVLADGPDPALPDPVPVTSKELKVHCYFWAIN